MVDLGLKDAAADQDRNVWFVAPHPPAIRPKRAVRRIHTSFDLHQERSKRVRTQVKEWQLQARGELRPALGQYGIEPLRNWVQCQACALTPRHRRPRHSQS